MLNKHILRIPALLIAATFMATGCVEDHLPEIADSFDKDAAFSTTVYRPILGRTTVFGDNFNAGNSTQPLTFTLTEVRHADGTPAPELTELFPVQVWTSPYLGTETSLQEIEAKRSYENRPLLQVRQHSGEIVMWANAKSSFVACNPSEGYVFTVKAENSGGYRFYTGLKLIPERETDYEPNNVDEETGFIKEDYIHPERISGVSAMDNSWKFLTTDDVRIYFHRDLDNKDKENTLTFKFLNSDYTVIDPHKFNQTDWTTLVHGFEPQVTEEYVRYKVAYPIPLNNVPTKYTDSKGEKASVNFRYDRIGRNGRRMNSSLGFDFSIFTAGHWEIVIVFYGGSPEFRDNM